MTGNLKELTKEKLKKIARFAKVYDFLYWNNLSHAFYITKEYPNKHSLEVPALFCGKRFMFNDINYDEELLKYSKRNPIKLYEYRETESS